MRHEYTWSASKGEWTLRHRSCQKDRLQLLLPDGSCCELCASLGDDRGLVEKVCRFVYDLDAARLLQHRMYQKDKVDAWVRAVQKKDIYLHRCKGRYDGLIAMLTKARSCCVLQRREENKACQDLQAYLRSVWPNNWSSTTPCACSSLRR